MEGNYDDVNRLCTQIADRYGWGFANINLRSYYAEGAKTLGFEVAEQLGWRFPDHLVSPVAGGTLLPRIFKAFREFRDLGLVEGSMPRIHAAQPTGSAPVIRALESGAEFPDPVKPNTIAKSLAIGNPADGFQVIRVVNETGGAGAMVSDTEILDAIELLARTEGIFTEPAGGTTAGGDQGAGQARCHQVGRVGGRVHHRQRIQDSRGRARSSGGADTDRAVTRRLRQSVGIPAQGAGVRLMTMFPAFLALNGRRVVVVGGGPVAAAKLGALFEAGALVTVVAPEVCAAIERTDAEIVRRAFKDADLDEAWWVVAAAPPEVNRQVQAAAETRRIFVNAVDDPRHASAFLGGVVRRAGVTIAISTDGRAPALAGLLREALDAWLPHDLDVWLRESDAVRQIWREQRVAMEDRRPQLLEALNRLDKNRSPTKAGVM